MSTILIGIDGSERSEDVIAFGGRLASASGADVIVAGASLRDDVLDRLEAIAPGRVTIRPLDDASPTRALYDLAEAELAALVIVGSTPDGMSERLLHGAPCAVAVVPQGPRAEAPMGRIGLAYDASEEARAAVTGAVDLARALDAELEVLGVVSTTGVGALLRGSEFRTIRKDLEHSVQHGLAALMAGFEADVTATSHRLTGDPAEVLCERTAELELLLMGSRGYGPLRSVLVGGVSGRVARAARCPVIVVPRGVEAPLGALFAADRTAC